MSAPPTGGRRGLRRVLDPRVLFGLAITAVTLWYSFRGVSFSALLRDMGRADLAILLIPSIPAYVWSIHLRALRWRHLTEGVAEIGTGPLFRATAVGFMANNIFPLRIGEVVRAWYLSRESGASGAALLGTVVVERLVDALCVLALAAVVLGTQGARATGLDPLAVLAPTAGFVGLGVAFLVALRAAPERAIGLGVRVGGAVLPERFTERLEHLLSQLARGLAGVRSGRSLAWVGFYSLLLWLLVIVVPFTAAIYSLGLDLDGPAEVVRASFSLLVWVGFAVAIPSAPGFFGPYHAACWVALRPFGVDKELAVALGTLSHGVFWLTMTGLGLAVLRSRGGRLDETLAPADAPGDDAPA